MNYINLLFGGNSGRPSINSYGGRVATIMRNNGSYIEVAGGSVKQALNKSIKILNEKQNLDRTNIVGALRGLNDARYSAHDTPVRVIRDANSSIMSASEAIAKYGDQRVDSVTSTYGDRQAWFNLVLSTERTQDATRRAKKGTKR